MMPSGGTGTSIQCLVVKADSRSALVGRAFVVVDDALIDGLRIIAAHRIWPIGCISVLSEGHAITMSST